MLVVSRRALFMLRFPLCCRRCRRCADPAALPKLPKLQNTSQLLTPPRIEADYSIKKMRRWHRVNLKPRGMSCLGPKDNVHHYEVPTQDLSKVEDEMPKLQRSKIK
jgi:hypothetical protein